MDKPKTTPKDFFLYFASFAALYVSAISLVNLLWSIVNKVFPDALNTGYYYYDYYSSGMRIAVASLIIIFPLYLVLATSLNRYLRAHPEKRELGIRKWLTYLTLFLTGLAVAIDLIVLVNTFLGGEITTRFVLKVLIVFIVAGAVFAYYIYDMRKSFSSTMPNRTKLIVTIAVVAVFGSLVGGFALLGSPMKARALRFDDRRISDLQTIQSQIIYSYWQQKGLLPGKLDDLNDSISGFIIPTDPETKEVYGYQATGDLSFRLCADFKLATVESPASEWKHTAGTTCFDRTIDTDLYPVQKPTMLRGL